MICDVTREMTLVERLRDQEYMRRNFGTAGLNAAKRIDEQSGTIARLEREKGELAEGLRNALQAIDGLIANSQGVAGLHLNGDVAPWDELLSGGRFEEWLAPLDQARALLAKMEWK